VIGGRWLVGDHAPCAMNVSALRFMNSCGCEFVTEEFVTFVSILTYQLAASCVFFSLPFCIDVVLLVIVLSVANSDVFVNPVTNY